MQSGGSLQELLAPLTARQRKAIAGTFAGVLASRLPSCRFLRSFLGQTLCEQALRMEPRAAEDILDVYDHLLASPSTSASAEGAFLNDVASGAPEREAIFSHVFLAFLANALERGSYDAREREAFRRVAFASGIKWGCFEALEGSVLNMGAATAAATPVGGALAPRSPYLFSRMLRYAGIGAAAVVGAGLLAATAVVAGPALLAGVAAAGAAVGVGGTTGAVVGALSTKAGAAAVVGAFGAYGAREGGSRMANRTSDDVAMRIVSFDEAIAASKACSSDSTVGGAASALAASAPATAPAAQPLAPRGMHAVICMSGMLVGAGPPLALLPRPPTTGSKTGPCACTEAHVDHLVPWGLFGGGGGASASPEGGKGGEGEGTTFPSSDEPGEAAGEEALALLPQSTGALRGVYVVLRPLPSRAAFLATSAAAHDECCLARQQHALWAEMQCYTIHAVFDAPTAASGRGGGPSGDGERRRELKQIGWLSCGFAPEAGASSASHHVAPSGSTLSVIVDFDAPSLWKALGGSVVADSLHTALLGALFRSHHPRTPSPSSAVGAPPQAVVDTFRWSLCAAQQRLAVEAGGLTPTAVFGRSGFAVPASLSENVVGASGSEGGVRLPLEVTATASAFIGTVLSVREGYASAAGVEDEAAPIYQGAVLGAEPSDGDISSLRCMPLHLFTGKSSAGVSSSIASFGSALLASSEALLKPIASVGTAAFSQLSESITTLAGIPLSTTSPTPSPPARASVTAAAATAAAAMEPSEPEGVPAPLASAPAPKAALSASTLVSSASAGASVIVKSVSAVGVVASGVVRSRGDWLASSFPSSDLHTLIVEPALMKRIGEETTQFAQRYARDYVWGALIQHTLLRAIAAAWAAPSMALSIMSLIDNTWSVALKRCDSAGAALAESLLEGPPKPVSLIAYGFGARIAFAAAKALAAAAAADEEAADNKKAKVVAPARHHAAAGVIHDLVLIGAPVPASDAGWASVRQVVAGRVVNAFSSRDMVLNIVFRTSNMGWRAAGACAVDSASSTSHNSTQVAISSSSAGAGPSRAAAAVASAPPTSSRIENFDISDLVRGHVDLKNNLEVIFARLRV